jgi:release factor glutamine methyltransferase
MKLGEWLRDAEARLGIGGIASAHLESQLMACHVLRVDRSWLLAHPEHEFNELAGEQVLQRRLMGEPLAYILGWREFFGRTFGVDRSVLIPRHETETLIEAALGLAPPDVRSVLDLGTGSGVLAVTLKLERPSWDVTAVDVSAEALTTASANARFLGAQVRFKLSDGFDGLLGESYDMIVSNPPYVGASEGLPVEVALHEPELALYSGPTGMEFYDRLAAQAQDHLEDGGLLLLEVGHTQSESVRELFKTHAWEHLETRRDLGGIERVLAFRHSFERY